MHARCFQVWISCVLEGVRILSEISNSRTWMYGKGDLEPGRRMVSGCVLCNSLKAKFIQPLKCKEPEQLEISGMHFPSKTIFFLSESGYHTERNPTRGIDPHLSYNFHIRSGHRQLLKRLHPAYPAARDHRNRAFPLYALWVSAELVWHDSGIQLACTARQMS